MVYADDAITIAGETSPLLPKSSNSSDLETASISSTNPKSSPCQRTISLVSALTNCLFAGSVLIFSLYAPLFNTHLHYRQMQINAVSVATELGMYLPVPIFGYICDRHGPRRLSLLSTAFFGPGYLLASVAYAAKADYKLMVTAFGLIGAGTSSLYFAGVTTCAKNFTGRRGLALATPIAAFGLSSLWMSQLVSRVFTTPQGVLQVEKVFLFFAASLVVVGILGGFGLRVEESEEEVEEEELLVKEEEDKGWVNAETRKFLSDRSMWAFAAGVFLVTGPGEAFINNMGTLIQTLGPSPVVPATQVSLIALTSTLARLLAGSLSDYLAPTSTAQRRRLTCSRIPILLFFSVLMTCGFSLISLGTIHAHPKLFWLVSTLVGAGYGAVFCLAPTVVSVVWGTKNFGTNWGIVTVTPALGAVVYGCVFAWEFDGETQDGRQWCEGPQCARWSFAVMAASVLVAVAGWTLVWRGVWRGRGVLV